MKHWWRGICVSMLGLRLWKWWQVRQFFRQPAPDGPAYRPLVSIMQPILSGDPALEATLEATLTAAQAYPREFIWLVDGDDATAQAICERLAQRHPQAQIRISAPPPGRASENPKVVKLVAGSLEARGEIICVLDDDTRLLAHSLSEALPQLEEPGVGLVFGLPYYHSFDTVWSTLVALLVNQQSLQTYIPYLRLAPPVTINGMFYALKRSTVAAIDHFQGLETILADDFAVARRIRQLGLELRQTRLRHPIGTHVSSGRRYLSLIQRWFIFPRESLLRHLSWREQALIYGAGLAPALFPAALSVALLLRPNAWNRHFCALYGLSSLLGFAWINRCYLHTATPWRYLPLVPLVELGFPWQLLAALLAPQRINWRGHVMTVRPGGGLEIVQRRSSAD